MRIATKAPVATLVLLSFLGGAAALIHQLIWVRRLVDVAGATADTFACVTGTFFLGLALGGWLASHTNETRRHRLLGGVAIAELLIAALAAGVLLAPGSGALFSLPVPATVLRLLISLLLIAPPAVCMGLTTPWLIETAALSGKRVAIPIYAFNTLGAVAGVLLALTVLLPAWGTVGTGLVAVGINLVIACSVLAMGAWRWPGFRGAGGVDGVTVGWCSLAFVSGFVVLGSEVVAQLQFTQVAVNSHFASGIVLALVLLGLAIGALISPPLLGLASRWGPGERSPIIASLHLLFVGLGAAAVQPALFWLALGNLDYRPYQVGVGAYLSSMLIPGLLSIGLPFVGMGIVFPSLLRAGEQARLPQGFVGRLLAWNGLGGWLGAEMTQGLLLPKLGLWGVAPFVVVPIAAITGIVIFQYNKRSAGGAFAILAGGLLVWALFSGRPQVAPSSEDAVRAVAIGREGVVAVVSGRENDLDWRILFNNSYTLGGSLAAANQERQAHLPILLHGKPKRVATLGLATGSTASGCLVHPSVERVDAIELSPLVAGFARRYFAPFNRDFFCDPRSNPILADARWEIARRPSTYDVVIGDLFLPWRSGEGRLFTHEHYAAVKRSLTPGGLYCQWLPMYQLTKAQFDAIAATFLEVFPNAFLIRGDFYSAQPILGLAGGLGLEDIAWEQVAEASARARDASRDPVARHVEGVAMMVIGPLARANPDQAKRVITLNNGWLEWEAGRNLIEGGEPWFAGVALAYYIRERHAAGEPRVPISMKRSHEAGQYFLTLAVAHEGKVDTGQLLPRFLDFLPSALRNDPDVDWQSWPSALKPHHHVPLGNAP
jgi:spermidine synthase